MRQGWVGLLVMAAFCAVVFGPEKASAATVSDATRCEIIKLKGVVKELKDKAQCYERSMKANAPVSQACFNRAEEKRQRIYDRAEERGGCKTMKDGATLGVRIDAFLQDATRTLSGEGAAAKAAATEEKKSDANDAKAADAKAPEATPSAEGQAASPEKKG